MGDEKIAKKRILFIEDEGQLVTMVKMRLTASGYEVLSASDGEAGVKKAIEIKPDLILLDILMPKMNGYEVSKAVRQNPETKNIPILIITASGAIGLEETCKQYGASGLIRKPYDASELLAKIDDLLRSCGAS